MESSIPLILLALRFMIAKKFDYEHSPFGTNDQESRNFMQTYISYLAQIKFDDLPHWSEEEIIFYNRRSFAVTKDSSREEIYRKL